MTAAANGEYDVLRKTVKGVLTLSILLDQFPRSLYRDSPQAFATDALAPDIVKCVVASGFDAGPGKTRRMFLYLPFEFFYPARASSFFSENLNDQNLAVPKMDMIALSYHLPAESRYRYQNLG